jgi:hypothetical protein
MSTMPTNPSTPLVSIGAVPAATAAAAVDVGLCEAMARLDRAQAGGAGLSFDVGTKGPERELWQPDHHRKETA